MGEFTFRHACRNGYLDVAKWLYSLGNVYIDVFNDYAFRHACKNGHLKVARWLFSLGTINIHAKKDSAFKLSCENEHLDVVKWLASICKMYSINIQNNKIIKWKILNPIDIYLENKEFSKIVTLL